MQLPNPLSPSRRRRRANPKEFKEIFSRYRLEVVNDQPEKPDRDAAYVPVDIRFLRSARRNLCCDVFVRLGGDKMTRVFSRETGLDFERLAQYIAKGVREVFVDKKDIEAFSKYIKVSPEQVISNEQTTNEEKVAALLDMAEQNMTEIFQFLEVPDKVAQKTQSIVNNFIEALEKEPKLLSGLIRSIDHNNFLFQHAVLTSIMSMLLADRAEQANRKMLQICGIGGLLHDIGMSQLPKEIVYPQKELSPEQWKEMRRHPLLGMRMIETSQIVPEEVRLIVFQHHEEPNGNGYPNNLRGPSIFYPAKIVAIADCFASMITDRSFRKAYSPNQAIEFMKQEVGRFDRELMKAAEELFSRKQKKAS